MAVIEPNMFSPMENALFCMKEQALQENTACYQLENGTFFLFKLEPPYTLSTVVEDISQSNHRKVGISLPPIDGQLICAGPYRDALYFYSTDDRKQSYTFYRTTLDEHQEMIKFTMIRKIETGNETLRFAHQQPFYSCEKLWKGRIFAFESGMNWHVHPVNENDPFFMHKDKQIVLKKGRMQTFSIEYSSPVFGNAEIRVADPEKATIYSRRNGFLYIIAREELLIYNESELIARFEIYPLGYFRDADAVMESMVNPNFFDANFSPHIRIVGVSGQSLVFCAAKAEGGPVLLWSLHVQERHFDPEVYANWSKSGEEYDSGCDFLNSLGHESMEILSVLITEKLRSGVVPAMAPKRRIKPQRRVADKTAIRKKKIVPSMKKKNEDDDRESNEESFEVLAHEEADRNVLESQISTLQLAEKVEPSLEFHSKFESDFTVIKILGVGGFGCVFRATNKYDEWDYAIKRVAVDANAISKALREVRAMARLEHPGIVGYKGTWIETPPEGWQHDADVEMLKQMGSTKRRIEFNSKYVTFKDDDVFIYIQMQLCNHSLSDWLKEHQEQSSRSLHQMKAWFKQIVSAVNYMHLNDIVHRDLKPSNILFAGSEILKVCDLGIATKRSDEDDIDTDISRSMAGTKLYMSPEQLDGKQHSSKTDVFTLGLILAELLVVMSSSMRSMVFDNFRRGSQRALVEDARAVEFIDRITRVNPIARPSCKEMLDHIFLA